MKKLLSLATAALKPGQLADEEHRKYPRVDYIELQRRNRSDVLDYDAYQRSILGEPLRWIETRVRSDVYLAIIGYLKRRSYQLVFAWSERVGIPYAGFKKLTPGHHQTFLTMFTCWSKRQEQFITRLKLFDAMDGIAVHCQSMKDHFMSLGVPEHKIKLIHYSIDQHFFRPDPQIVQQPGLLLSLGEVRSRDYPSLFQAVDGLPVDLLVAASGAWYAREKDTSLNVRIPKNVKVASGFSQAELKNLYAQSQFVVLPLYDQVYSAGATVALEAMSMARPVIAFASRGICDYIIDGQTGILVKPGDVNALQNAIRFLLDHPGEARRMGQNARKRIEAELNLERYVDSINSWLNSFVR